MKFSTLSAFVMFFLITQLSLGQNSIIGIITDEQGVPLQGAIVLIKDSRSGTIADVNGMYTLTSNISFPWTMVISYVGYNPEERIASTNGAQDFKLTESISLAPLTIVGTRGKQRTDLNRPIPVDIISSIELQSTGQMELGQQLQFASPSYNSAKSGINGSLVYADYATLRGLGPDQLLFLVNGKRRHQSSIPHIGFSVSRGMVVTDVNTIPSLAITQSEILKDGASAQYGSDAIAGIVNFKLRETVGEGTFKTQYGITSEGDGASYMAALNYGFKLGKEKSFLNFTLHYQQQGETNRSEPYTGTIYSSNRAIDDSIRAARGFYPASDPFTVGVFGQSKVSSPQFFVNAAYPLSNKWALYTFGGYSHKKALGYGFFRNAIPGNSNSIPEIYPNGFVPEFPAESEDMSAVIGITRNVLDHWSFDFSTGYGRNAVDRFAENTANASIGATSPTEFYVGFSSFSQSTTEANISRNFTNVGSLKALHLSLGSQLRIDGYDLQKGDEFSYLVGPLAFSKGKTPGVQGIAGTSPEDEADATRTNIGVYADVEADITTRFLVALAVRYENYSDFGSNVSGKFATRFRLTDHIALRGSVNRGFRAPSLQQLYNSATSTLVQAGEIVFTKQFSNASPLLKTIGIESPTPEISLNYNLGLAVQAGINFGFSVDAYHIDVTDKIIISNPLVVSAIAALSTQLQGTGIQRLSFFTNHVDTRTQGIDVMSTYKTSFSATSRLNLHFGATLNKTTITKIKDIPAKLQEGTTNPITLIDTISIALIETAQPNQKFIFAANYYLNKLELTARATFFGKVTAWEKPTNMPFVAQEFSAKTVLDIALGYAFTDKIKMTAGVNNVTNQYPDKVLPNLSAFSAGQTPYNRNVNQFGYAGAFYYGNLTFKF